MAYPQERSRMNDLLNCPIDALPEKPGYEEINCVDPPSG
jgi:hypothetical protein